MTIRSVAGLAEAGLIDESDRVALERVAGQYAVALTPAILAAIDVSDPADPIARQFVPSADELVMAPDELADPIGDEAHSPVRGIVHRYPDRVLLKLLHVCPVYCRFCFRREMVGPGEDAALSRGDTEAALAYIASTPAIWEVIFTGGDPFLLSPKRLAEIMRRLDEIPHVRVVRFHTRVPAVDPERVTADLTAAIRVSGKAVYVALHANHARELSPDARAACGRLVDAGIPMLGQTVLLRGVNDTPAELEALMRALVETRIKPYYLHHADLAPGTGHMRTSIAAGQQLVGSLRGHVSGLCQPTYVLDLPGGYGKVALAAPVRSADDGRYEFHDRDGVCHTYRDTAEQGDSGSGSPSPETASGLAES